MLKTGKSSDTKNFITTEQKDVTGILVWKSFPTHLPDALEELASCHMKSNPQLLLKHCIKCVKKAIGLLLQTLGPDP